MQTTPLVWSIAALSSVALGSELPEGAPPVIFAPGIISGPANDGTPTFSPDGKSLCFTRSGANGFESIILESSLRGGRWSQPTVAMFSGEWYDSSPSWAPDGSYLVFQSSRPGAGGATHVSHLWRVERQGNGCSTPKELAPAVNIGPLVYRPSLAADGTLYFISKATAEKKFRLYCSVAVKGVPQPAHPLPFSDGTYFDVDPEVAPDQSFLIFASAGRAPFKDAGEHLFLARRTGTGWGPAQPLRYIGDDWAGATFDDDPRLGSDHITLYFSSDRSPSVHYPLSARQANEDLDRMRLWNNGNANVWFMALPGAGG